MRSIKTLQNYVGHNHTGDRVQDDFYATPEDAIAAILARETFEGEVWEPACGDGAISKRLVAKGYNVYSTDLVDRGYGDDHFDFLSSRRMTDNIITNPPFNVSTEFTVHALNLARRKVVMFQKLTFLEGMERRKKLFSRGCLEKVYVFTKRVSFVTVTPAGAVKKGGLLAFAWFVFNKEFSGDPIIKWI